jgi:hypothetical protein
MASSLGEHMKDFTITELYEISDGLTERRTRLLKMQDNPLRTSKTLERMINAAQSAHTKIMNEIVNRTSTL